MELQLEDFRREYTQGGLERDDLDADPLVQFGRWMEQTIKSGIPDPNAMTVATVDETGQPSQRIVLLKHVDEKGFVFYTNLNSRKAKELKHNPRISLHFPWYLLERQVKVCGVAEQLSTAEVVKYFVSRPRESQLGAWASQQSRPIPSRALLMQQFEAMKNKFAKGEIPLPDFWGGFRVKPHQMEFWQGGAHRLHDRFQYNRQTDGRWTIDRLEP
ncbi:pyridoxamine 5'-phosphate oxidase [Cellvibrio japonicus]|uniref:Pyridoxine/pyridoxamine 5'-phosphate oxidase n=1 Tax=Cellvibrio japonicus (strain Ueda107) TaxID=498211 RepID=B3PCX8_CELJU|nr:pyridoxamine 5'-phosphate oxidase [Cellvibrio japonicus]ACE85725.1 pyridoxamine 5'-phosphate oxidase [Cellvibrio japonicus Ueda107]QEI11922.1 pyridoxamine 5'-phosphate oxidase [Cellvibrio japonicus]QEI15496.1 pyridoxamine 5'-phosphate oxidase [Cellvibrio japonicus]QEI19075.1 pyridoxamine 5'-phosphate oxidase [Cellvibrio japonicus]